MEEASEVVFEAPNAALAQAVKITLKNAGIPFAEEILQHPYVSDGLDISAGGHYAHLRTVKSRAEEARHFIAEQLAAYEKGELELSAEIGEEQNNEAYNGHRILTLGIIALATWQLAPVGLLFGLMAWRRGNTDLQKIEEGIMPPEGRALTGAGRTCGKVAAILSGLVLFLFLLKLIVASGRAPF